jgi:hypothetical protein
MAAAEAKGSKVLQGSVVGITTIPVRGEGPGPAAAESNEVRVAGGFSGVKLRVWMSRRAAIVSFFGVPVMQREVCESRNSHFGGVFRHIFWPG